MTPLFKKLNFKNQSEILVLNHPQSFEAELTAMKAFTKVATALADVTEIAFVIVFVQAKETIDAVVPAITEKLVNDGVVWFAYPKGTSKKYKATINRDNGWDALTAAGFDTVRTVAIDEDWSGLRFRELRFARSDGK